MQVVEEFAGGAPLKAYPKHLRRLARPTASFRRRMHLNESSIHGEPVGFYLDDREARGARRATELPAALAEVTPAYVALVVAHYRETPASPRRLDIERTTDAPRGPDSALLGRARAA